jgi:hypothetical protein
MFSEMLKEMWNSFEWQGKAIIIAIPIALFWYATATFAPPNCDYDRNRVAMAMNETDQYRDGHIRYAQEDLRSCERAIAINANVAAAEKVDPWHVLRRTAATTGYKDFWMLWAGLILPLGCVLSYANAAGRWGNAAYVKASDFYGMPLGFFFSIGFFVHAMVALDLLQTGVELSQTTKALFVGCMLCAMVFALPMMFILGAEFARDLWKTTKGLAMLVHYAFTTHPAEMHLPSHPDVPINRHALREALTGRYVDQVKDTGSMWTLVKPRFMYEHELFRANKVEELLRADTTILQEAIRRERTRTEAGDLQRS